MEHFYWIKFLNIWRVLIHQISWMKNIKSNFQSPQRRKIEENKTTNESTWNIFVARFSFGVLSSHIFVIYFVISLFTKSNNLSKHSGVILNFILFLLLLNRIQKGEHTPNTLLISFLHWSHFVCFFIHFFFIIDNCNYGSLLRKCLKMKIFSLFTIAFYFLHKCCSDNFASAIICWHTLKKLQISLGRSLDNCRVLREILKAAAMQELPSDLSFLMFFFILNMTLTYLLK